MSRLHLSVVSIAFSLLWGCVATDSRSASARVPPEAAPLSGAARPERPLRQNDPPLSAGGAPLVIAMEGPSIVAPNSEFDVTLHIRRARPNSAPMELRVTLPPGTTLLAGASSERIVDPTTLSIARHFKLHINRVPDGDIAVVLDQHGIGFGIHATAWYRFGRPEPRLPQPMEGAPNIGLGGSIGGHPVNVQ